MSTNPTDSQTYSVTYRTRLDTTDTPAGVIAIGPDQRIEIVSAEEKFASDLRFAAKMLNAGKVFNVPASPAPGGSPRAIRKRGVPRESAEAREALIDVLRSTYSFHLAPKD
jgi:hypothetical protein